jgi:hypothetical protein
MPQDGVIEHLKKVYLLTVETDFDFSFTYRGKLMADYRIVLQMESVTDLDNIVLQGPFGAPGLPEKSWEFDEAMAAIRKNPDEEFSNLGGNRGVEWSPRTVIAEDFAI